LGLLKHLNRIFYDQRFKNKTEFIEKIYSLESAHEKDCNAIYKFERRKNKKSSQMSSAKWSDLKRRLGINSFGIGDNPQSMSFEHFIKMESKLFKSLDLHPAVRNLVLKLIQNERDRIVELRKRQVSLRPGTASSPMTSIIITIERELTEKRNRIHLPTLNLASCLTLIADTGVMFTSRDWTTTGTISGLCSITMSTLRLSK